MNHNAPASETSFSTHYASDSKLCAGILNQVPTYIAGSGAPWCRDFRISSSTSLGQNVSPYSPCFTTREILRSGLGASTVPANHRIDTDRFAAGHAGR